MHCAHVPCPWVPITYFFVCIFLGRIVLHVTSAQCCGVLQKVTRRRRICEWTPWCVPAHRSEGGGTSADAPWAPTPPHPVPRHHLPPPVTIPPSRWMGVSKISALSPCRGRTKSSSFLCLSKPESTSLLFDDPVWFFLCARFCGPGSSLPPVFHPGSAESMAAELDKIRNGPNCV